VRDLFIDAGGINRLLEVTDLAYRNVKLMKFWCKALINLCRGSRIPKYEKVRDAVSALCKAVASGRIKDK
jgi:hypothetical protein